MANLTNITLNHHKEDEKTKLYKLELLNEETNFKIHVKMEAFADKFFARELIENWIANFSD